MEDSTRMKKRDKTLDRLRGFAMLWVIVVHVLYWGNIFTSGATAIIKSWLLFEMPLLFFVMGASNSFNVYSNYFNFVYRRIRRIMIPYWFFAIICAALSIIQASVEIKYAIVMLISWTIPVNRQITSIPYLTWALWFVPVYLCVVCTIPALRRMRYSGIKFEFGFLLVFIFILMCRWDIWLSYVVFYSIWVYVGLFYCEINTAIRQKYTVVCGGGMYIYC